MYEAEQRAPRTTGRVRFRARAFERVPTVLVALNMLDLAGDADLRIRVEVEDVDREGFTWRLESWVSFCRFAFISPFFLFSSLRGGWWMDEQ
jgi:hypothetical protein